MISTLAVLKKKMVERPYLYEAEEHAVLRLAEDAVQFIQDRASVYDPVQQNQAMDEWLEAHK